MRAWRSMATTMNVAIMQPYFFPYLGYFQLLAAVDCFVILDDVNFIRNGWIHRNRILRDDKAHLFTLAINGASSYKRINELTIFQAEKTKHAILNLIHRSYRMAPFYEANSALLSEISLFPEENLSRYLSYSLRQVSEHLNLSPRIILSSEMSKDTSLTGQARVIEICKQLGATKYINPIGGMKLYDPDTFELNSIELYFLSPQIRPYPQFSGAFVPRLSIIDTLMFTSIDEIQDNNLRFVLIRPDQKNELARILE